MTKEILIILACVPLYVINAFCDKIVSGRNQNKYNVLYNSFKFLICSFCMLPMLLWERGSLLGSGAFVCGLACGVMYAVSKTVMLKGYERTSVAFMTLCHSSGMILPCILGHFFWGERLSSVSVVGILLAILSIVLLKGGNQESRTVDVMGISFGILIFLTSAGVMISQKLMGRYFAEQSVGGYNFYSFIVAFLILVCFIRPKRLEEGEKKEKKLMLLCALGSAVSLSIISFVMTNLAKNVPSIVLFPLFNGLGILCVCLGSVWAFREKLTKKKTVGLVLGLVGLFLVNL